MDGIITEMKFSPIAKFIFILLLSIVLINGLAVYFSWYWYVLWFDMPMHFFGGLWVGLTSLWIVYISGYFKIPESYRDPDKVVFVALFSTAIIGLLWEVFEFSVDTLLVIAPTYDVSDTLSDIAFDMAGALLASTVFTSKELYKKQ